MPYTGGDNAGVAHQAVSLELHGDGEGEPGDRRRSLSSSAASSPPHSAMSSISSKRPRRDQRPHRAEPDQGRAAGQRSRLPLLRAPARPKASQAAPMRARDMGRGLTVRARAPPSCRELHRRNRRPRARPAVTGAHGRCSVDCRPSGTRNDEPGETCWRATLASGRSAPARIPFAFDPPGQRGKSANVFLKAMSSATTSAYSAPRRCGDRSAAAAWISACFAPRAFLVYAPPGRRGWGARRRSTSPGAAVVRPVLRGLQRNRRASRAYASG